MKKYNAEKERQKRIKRLFRKARIKKDASRDEIDANTIGYFKKKGVDTKVSLLDEQCDDPMFLISLYKSAPDTMWQFPPREENKKMVLNSFFMAEYIKLKAERESKLCSKDALESVVWFSFRRYRDCALNPEFVALIGNKYPEIDIISAVKNAVITHNYYINKEEVKKQIEEYTTLLNALPKELLEREVRKHGEYILKKLPRSLPGFIDLICVGIEHDGFKSLSLLDVDNILDHKDMVVKAYEHDGVEELRVFLTKNLSPHREHWYICHEEPHSYNYFSEKHKAVQDALLKDEQIVQILKNEQLAARIKTMQKIESLIKEQDSEDIESENE